MPPGNFGLRLPSSRTTLQYGVIRFLFCPRSSSAASATIRTKMPVVKGQVTSASWSRASFSLMVPTVTSLPFGTFRSNPFTSDGVGINIIPLPKRDILGGTLTSLASCGRSSFSRQEVRLVNLLFNSSLLSRLVLSWWQSKPGFPAY